MRWERRQRRQNHWLNAPDSACAAGHLAGVRLVDEVRPEPPPEPPPRPPRPDGPWWEFDRHGRRISPRW